MAILLYDLAAAEEDRRFSPYCWRAKLALKHKGLAFETVPWRFTDKQAIAFSGAKTVPVIKDGDTVVADSWSIAVYLDQAYPSRPSLFEGAQSRTLCEFFNQWVFRTPQPALFKVVILDLFALLHENDKAYFRTSREQRFGMTLEQFAAEPKQKLAEFRAALEPVRPVLAQNRFLSGNAPAYADYLLFGAFQWGRCMSPIHLLEADDPLYPWRERMLDLFDGYARRATGYPV
jgi:glutathione S-transferase